MSVFLFSITGALASHIVGGDFTYKRLSGNNFEITLKLYRDCAAMAPFDTQINIGIFEQGTNAIIDSTVTLIDSVYLAPLTMPGTVCAPPPDVCAEVGVYIDTLSLPSNPNGYYITWQRCCRNGGIVNIKNGLNTGIVFYMEIPDPAIINSSPTFDFEPLPYVCEEQPFTFDYSATDPDGDVLVYSAAAPLAGTLGYPLTGSPSPTLTYQVPGPYPTVDWNPGYNLGNMFGSNTPLAVDPTTGFLNAVIDLSGLYAVAVEVREYRNGVQIGLIRREIEISSIICLNQPPNLTPYNTPLTFNIYETDTLCRKFYYEDLDADSMILSVSGNVLGGGGTTPPYATATVDTGSSLVESDFCWITQCGQADDDPYYLVYTVVDNGCPLPFTTKDSIAIMVNPMPVFGPANILCSRLITNDQLKVVWSDSSIIPRYFDRYEVYRSTNGGPYSVIANISNDTVRSYTDNSAFANTTNDYCYYIKGVNDCGVKGPASDTICSVSQINSKQNYIEYVTVTSPNTIKLKWEHFPDGPYSTFYLYQKQNNISSSYSLVNTIQYPGFDSIMISGVNTGSSSYCYYLQNADWCGNESPVSNEACTIHIQGEAKPLVNFTEWNTYNNWLGGTDRYELEVSNGNAGIWEPLNSITSIPYEYYHELPEPLFGQFGYRIIAFEGAGGFDAQSRSNEIVLEQVPFIYAPNAFTPNGDGINDYWTISSNYVKDGSVAVYNRWGQEIFNGSIYNWWDGTFNGTKVPEGVYVFRIEYQGYNTGKPEFARGFIHVIR